ncbi:6149_t:CDS:2 [Funneliformis mosseae]|uniref:6149_t:CDS:1 n=1 Tax=Funneliformis mosseae TaxID=27381 RepID=A0A9N8WNG2_FUNMO|nr:6149_t:CDS:2 [Funneliformis mosseae]
MDPRLEFHRMHSEINSPIKPSLKDSNYEDNLVQTQSLLKAAKISRRQSIAPEQSESCCNIKIVKELNGSSSKYNYEIIRCSKSKSESGRKSTFFYKVFSPCKVICGKGKTSYTVTARCNVNKKKVVIKRVDKDELKIPDYYKPPCFSPSNCSCGECLYASQPSPPSSVTSSNVIGSRRNSYVTATTWTGSNLSNNSPPTSILNNSSQLSIHNGYSQTSYFNNSPSDSILNVGTPHSRLSAQFNKPKKAPSVTFASSAPSCEMPSTIPQSSSLETSSIVARSSTIASSIKSNSSHSSISVQPPSIYPSHIDLIPIELQALYCNSNDYLPAYINYFVDDRYYYYITKNHGVRQRKLKKPSSWFKKKYFDVDWVTYVAN